jgi:hypothetical protein
MNKTWKDFLIVFAIEMACVIASSILQSRLQYRDQPNDINESDYT